MRRTLYWRRLSDGAIVLELTTAIEPEYFRRHTGKKYFIDPAPPPYYLKQRG